MFRNYLIVAIRNLMRYKVYSVINILGLAVGMAGCLLILLFVQNELSYDQFHKNADQIYRVAPFIGGPKPVTFAPAPMGPAMVRDFPQVKSSVRLYNLTMLTQLQEKRFYENITFADPNILEMFTLPLVKGYPKTALSNPDNILLTEQTAHKYFGQEDPIGKMLTLGGRISGSFTVTGILKNLPKNSTLQFDFLASFSSLEGHVKFLYEWAPCNFATYLLLSKSADPSVLEAGFPTWRAHYVDVEDSQYLSALSLQRLTDIHLYIEGHITYVYAFTAIAVFVLLIACVNFINLSTARSATRAKEVGLRKVAGARRIQLVGQFLSESAVVSFLALLLAIVMVEQALPAFNALAGKDLKLTLFDEPVGVLGLFGATLLVGMIAGSYPAFFLSAFKPVSVLKGYLGTRVGRARFQKALVVVQFSIAIALMIGTGIIHRQVNYMKNKNLGLKDEQVIVISKIGTAMPHNEGAEVQRYQTFKQEILKNPNILDTAFSSVHPAKWYRGLWSFQTEGSKARNIASFIVDANFIQTLGLKLISGRNFEIQPKGTEEEYILNETAVRELLEVSSPKDAIGVRVNWSGNWGRVIGVVKDFHVESMRSIVAPMLMVANPKFRPFAPINLLVRVRPDNIQNTLHMLENTWKAFAPDYPLTFSFLDEDFNHLYFSEQQQGKIFDSFTTLAIFVGCLGLFGLSIFAAERRKKEIGIRKVLGASAENIALLLSKDFIKLIIVASLIAWPMAYYTMSRWLQDFAYRINLGVGVFVLGSLLAIVIAFATVSWQAIKAANSNPVDSLRQE